MSRAAGGDVIEIKPSNDMYTVLIAIAIIAELIAFIALMAKAGEIFVEGKGLFS
jgi:nucleoside permease NupC